MDLHDKLDELAVLVENARSMPMSASCVMNRAELLGLLDDIKKMLPDELAHAEMLLRDREAVIDGGRREAERIMASAHEQRGTMVANSEVSREAMSEAERIRSDALREAYQIRQEADDYVDQKLANFEVVLTKTLAAVGRGREKLRGRRPADELGEYVQAADEAQAQAQAQAAQAGYPDSAAYAQAAGYGAGYGSDESGFFDTGMIDARAVRDFDYQQPPAYDQRR